MLENKLEMLSKTNMVDFAIDVYKTLYPDQDIPQSMSNKFPYVSVHLLPANAMILSCTGFYWFIL